MNYFIIFFILIATIGVSFALESKEIIFDEPFMIKLNQTASFDNHDLVFSRLEDSRCPSDVTCVWAGRASVTLVIQNQTQSNTIVLTTDDNSTSYVDSYQIHLIDVLPYPITTKDISKDYVAKISISKIKNGIILPPLKQFKSGVKSELVSCKSALVLVIKNNDGSPACVKAETKAHLLERGWATDTT